MKDKSMGKINIKFVGLNSKMYSLTDADGNENRKAKGDNKNVVNNTIHEEFVATLFNKKIMRHNMKRVNRIELELMIFVRFLCLVLMIKDTYQMMALIVWLIFIKI